MIRYLDMFVGIGGFRSALERVGGFKCVAYCEIDKYAKKAYEAMYLRYSARVWLIGLGLNGDEFHNCRKHLISHLDGCISWRHPEDAIAQRERLKKERLAQREQRVEPVCEDEEPAEVVHTEETEAAVNDRDEDFEDDEEITEDVGFSMSM